MASRSELLQARTEAAAANRLQPSAAAWVLLAEIELKQGKPESAQEYTGQALRLEPANEQALAMQREIAAQAANKNAK